MRQRSISNTDNKKMRLPIKVEVDDNFSVFPFSMCFYIEKLNHFHTLAILDVMHPIMFPICFLYTSHNALASFCRSVGRPVILSLCLLPRLVYCLFFCSVILSFSLSLCPLAPKHQNFISNLTFNQQYNRHCSHHKSVEQFISGNFASNDYNKSKHWFWKILNFPRKKYQYATKRHQSINQPTKPTKIVE